MSQAQAPTWIEGVYSAKPVPNPAVGNATCIITASAKDAVGTNIFVTGYFANTIDFPTTTGNIRLVSNEYATLFVGKWSTVNRAWVWITSSAGATGNAITVNGNDVYVTGSYSGGSATISGTTLTNVNQINDSDGFVAKYTDQGSSVANGWAIKFGGSTVPSSDAGQAVVVSGNNLYVSGKFYGTVTVGSNTLTSGGQSDVFLAKYDLSTSPATARWAVGGGSTRSDEAPALAVSGNNVYIGGTFANSLTLNGTTLTTSGLTDRDLFLAKFIDNGSSFGSGWFLSNGGTGGAETVNDLKVVGSNLFVTGAYYGGGATIAGVNLSTPNNTNMQLYVAKYTDGGSAATPRWAAGIPAATGYSTGNALEVSGNAIFVTGTFSGNATIAGTLLTNTGLGGDIFLARFTDNTGSVAGVGTISAGGTSDSDQGYGLHLVGSKVYVTGYARPNATFGNYSISNPAGVSSVPFIAVASAPGVAAANSAPTDISLSNNSVAENAAVNTTVGTLSATDPDASNTFTYALVSGSGSTDNASFNISGNTLQTSASFNYETKSSYSIRLSVTDQGGLSYEKAFTITITNVNEAPINTVPGIQTTAQNIPKVFSTAGGNAISVSDPDVGSSNLQITLTATNGVLTLAAATGLNFSTGDGTGDATMTFQGTQATVNSALNGLSFTPSTNFNGSASITILTNDLGNTGSGGAKSDTKAVTVTVTATAPTITSLSASPNPVCAGSSITFTATIGNVSSNYAFTLTNGSSTSIASSAATTAFSQNLTAVGSGTQNFSLIVASNGLSATATVNVTVNSLPNASFTGLAATYCANAAAVTLTSTTAGGSFSGPGVSGTTFTPANAGTGGTITYSVTVSGCTNTSSQNVAITPLANAAFTGLAATYCANAAAVTLTPTTAGGSFSGPGVSGTTFTPANAGTGGTITYSVTVSGCTATSSQNVTITPAPNAGFTGLNATYCANAAAVTLTPTTAGGTFSGPGVSGTTFTPANASTGGTITYSVTVSGCTATSSQNVSITPAPNAGFSGLSATYCANAAAVTLTPTTAGGTFSGPGVSGTTFTPANAGTGGTITYSVTVSGCTATSSQNVSITPAPNAGFSGLNATYCANAAAVTLTPTTAGGSFSGPGVSGTTFTPANAGTGGTITYSVTVSGCTNTSSQNVAITPLANAAFTGLAATYCANSAAVTLTPTTTGGTFSGPGVSGTTFSPANASTGGTITYSVTVSGCTNTSSQNVTVNPLPNASLTNNGPLTDTNPTVTLTAGGGASYTFSAGAAQQNGANTATVTSPGTYQVTVTSQGCSATAYTTVTGAANQSSCRNGTAVINVVASGNPVKYEWYRNSINSARLTENPAQVRGTSTASLTLINQQVTANYYVRVTDQNGSAIVYGPFKMTVDLNCNVYGRLGETEAELKITLLGNPIQNNELRATVSGAAGKALTVHLLDLNGKPLRSQHWVQAQVDQPVLWQLGDQASGMYLLQASTEAEAGFSTQQQVQKVIKP